MRSRRVQARYTDTLWAPAASPPPHCRLTVPLRPPPHRTLLCYPSPTYGTSNAKIEQGACCSGEDATGAGGRSARRRSSPTAAEATQTDPAEGRAESGSPSRDGAAGPKGKAAARHPEAAAGPGRAAPSDTAREGEGTPSAAAAATPSGMALPRAAGAGCPVPAS